MTEKPIARCKANNVDAYAYPFYVKPARGMEPAYIFLEEHVFNFNEEEVKELAKDLVPIKREQDLQDLGFEKNDDGIYVLSEPEKPWLNGGKS